MVSIAVVQLSVAQYKVEANISKMQHFIEEAANAGADLIVFPEDALTGPINGDRQFVDFEGRHVRHFQQLASQYAIDIVPGSIIEGDSSGWYNTTYYIDKTGTIKGKYRKVHLWHPERAHLTPGSGFSVFETEFGKVGLIICWDLIFPETFRAMVKQGVDTVICPSYWCFEDAGIGLKHNTNAEIVAVNALCVARAFENEIVVVFANAAASAIEKEEHLLGRSQIAVPFKGVLKMLDHTDEEMFIQAVETTILKDAETAYKIRNDLKIEIEQSYFRK